MLDTLPYIIIYGIIIGVLISAPMGPVGMLVIQRTLSKGRWAAFFTGVGAAFSDLFYCLLTGFCLSFVSEFMETNKAELRIVGSAVLLAFGIYLCIKNPTRALKPAAEARPNVWFNLSTGFLFTLSNPFILVLTIGFFSQYGFTQHMNQWHHYIIAYASIFIGALVWWYVVTLLVNMLRSRFNVRALWLVNRIIGLILIGTAIYFLIYAIELITA